MSERPVPKSFIVAVAFVFAVGFAALVLLGAGITSVLTNADEPLTFGDNLPGFGIPLTVIAALCFALAAIRAGLRFRNRVRWGAVLGIALTTWVCGFIAEAIATLAFNRFGVGDLVFAILAFIFQPPGWIIFGSALLAGWAYLGTLGWQQRNGSTKQFA
jgi:hypothetical protein